MDKILAYFITISIIVGLLIGGNYFLTDSVGNFNMEKVRNLIPNISMVLEEKKNEIIGTRDIEDSIVIQNNVHPENSVFEEYIKDWNVIDNNTSWTTMQYQIEFQKFINKYSSQRNNWTGNVMDVIEYSNGFSITLESIVEDLYPTLFCNTQNRKMALNLRKGQTITVIGDFKFAMRSPWLYKCEIVSIPLAEG